MINIYGDLPNGNIIFVSVDSIYYNDHAKNFAKSVNKNTSYKAHIHIINPIEDDMTSSVLLKRETGCTVSYEKTEGVLDRVYYACNRFIVAPLFLENCNSMLIVDYDSFCRKDFEWPKEVFGLFLRDPLPGTVGLEHYGTHVAAGVVLYSREGLEIARAVSDVIRSNEPQWFIDQAALYNVYEQFIKNNDVHENECVYGKFKQFGSEWIDWEFENNSIVWTGKGNRKTSEKYLNEREIQS
jgi:hypothetical protein